MAKSLQEQLLQTGVAKPKHAKKARREKAQKARSAKQQGKQKQPDTDQALQTEIAAADAAKRERDRQLNEAQAARRRERDRDNSATQLIERNRVAARSDASDAVTYHYNLESRIRRIDVGDDQRRSLAAGRLAIVRHREVASLVPAEVARRLQQTIPDQVWLVTETDDSPDPNDPYADYPVPDDLMW